MLHLDTWVFKKLYEFIFEIFMTIISFEDLESSSRLVLYEGFKTLEEVKKFSLVLEEEYLLGLQTHWRDKHVHLFL